MFVGEIGCFVVVFLSCVYRQFIHPRISRDPAPLFTSDGYQAVRSEEESAEVERVYENALEGESQPPPPSGGGNNKQLGDDNRNELRGARIVLLAAPACCDIAGTTLMNVGLLFVAASIYQMTRGALVLFVGLFSVLFLHRRVYLYQWLSLVGVVLGVALVGISGALYGHDGNAENDSAAAAAAAAATTDAQSTTREAMRTVIGILLIAVAQVFTATQFVLEEWILENSAMDALQVAGWEGVFGLLVTLVGMVVLYFTVGRTDAGRYGYFDVVEGWREITGNRTLAICSILSMLSIGYDRSDPRFLSSSFLAHSVLYHRGYNFFGLSVTRNVSATSRSTIDTSRTVFIWVVSLCLGWETFKWLQVVGFAVLVYATFLFNNVVRPPFKICVPSAERPEELLAEEPIEHM